MDIEDFLQAVCGVSVEVGFERAEGLTMEEFVLFDESFEFFLDAS